MNKAVLGVVGGSGIYNLPALSEIETLSIESPWGYPSAPLRRGRIGATEVVFLSRHGIGHSIPPSEINYRANIDCLKRCGVTDIISLSACGSFREELYPGTFVLVNQFIDRTYRRASSFFGTGCVAHVSMANPVGPVLAEMIADAAEAEGIPVRRGGTYVCIEGPQFSTIAESHDYRAAGYDVIGMTNMPEAKLAREAEITYASVAMVTDYDSWHDSGPIDIQSVLSVMNRNTELAARLVGRLGQCFPVNRIPCPVGSERALDYAVITARDVRDPALVAKLDAVAGRVLRS